MPDVSLHQHGYSVQVRADSIESHEPCCCLTVTMDGINVKMFFDSPLEMDRLAHAIHNWSGQVMAEQETVCPAEAFLDNVPLKK